MTTIICWAIAALVFVTAAGLIGKKATYLNSDGKEVKGHWLGILIDDRFRFSMTHLQVVLWTIVLLSMLTAVFVARLLAGEQDPLTITIPPELLALAGISAGSAVVATAAKSARSESVRKRMITDKHPTQFFQVFMVEDGEGADKVVDVTKFQNFFFTIIAVIAYIVLALKQFVCTAVPGGLPTFSEGILWIIGISHASYVGGKLPPKK
jgi:hypothetical protein